MSNEFTTYLSNVKKGYKIKNHVTYYVLLAFIAVYGIMGACGALKLSQLVLLQEIGYTVIAAVSLSLVVGFLGELSLGHAAFMSLGAYIGGYMQTYVFGGLTAFSPLLSIIVAMIIGGVVAAVFGFVIGLPALRLKGDYLAIVTLAFCEIVKTVFQNSNAFGGALGMSTYKYPQKTMFLVSFVMVVVTVALIQNLIRSKHGRAIMAIRDNEIAARAMGVNVTYYKLMVFVLSAFFAGIAGVLFSNGVNRIDSKVFDYNYSINILVMVVLGGMGNINGTIIASVLIVFINNKLGVLLTGRLAALKNLIYALILILIVIYNNAPKLKSFREKHNFRVYWNKFTAWVVKLFTKKQPAVDPAKETESNADWSKIPTKVEMDAILSTDLTPDDSYVPDKPDKPQGE